MRKLFNRKNYIELLPYIREDIHGLYTDSPQTMGWELLKFNIPSVWSQAEGDGVVVAVIDTGCDLNHEDLKGCLLTDGKNFVERNSPPMDVAGHGSHVASTIAAQNNGTGMVGIAPKTKILPIKALDNSGRGSMQNIAEAIKWAADRKVDFITMSLGSPAPAPTIEEAINYANNKGCIIFCAAGNSGPNSDIMYPAKYNGTIAIGAIDENLNRTRFTCSGETLDFLSPGQNILGCVPGNKYALMSGTSMSNPFATGCASLLLSYNKKHHKYTLETYEDYVKVFSQHSKDLEDPQYKGIKKYQGYGILYPVF
jgi:subtilisin family serine protease